MRHVRFSEDQQMLRETSARFLRERYLFEHRESVRRSADGFDPAIWREFADMGWLGLPFPEEYGGLGASALDVALLMEAFGPALVAEPYVPTVVAAGTAIMAGAGHEMKADILPRIAAGELRLALAFSERESGYDHAHPALSASRDGEGFLLSGDKAVVVGAPLADLLVVSAMAREGLTLFLVPRDAAGLSLRPYPTIDGQRAAEIRFESVALPTSALIGFPGAGLAALDRAAGAATVALLGEAAGLVQAAVDRTAHYLNMREQFGRKLASFQALRHRVARMYVGKEEVRALCWQAAAAFSDDPAGADAREAIWAAKVHAGRVGRHICEEAIQLHGAIAISDEYVVGHYLKRMVMIDHMFGNANHHFDLYVNQVRSLAPRAA